MEEEIMIGNKPVLNEHIDLMTQMYLDELCYDHSYTYYPKGS